METFTNPQTAFETAIKGKLLSASSKEANFVGKYMYMGNKDDKHLFKNIITREYASCERAS